MPDAGPWNAMPTSKGGGFFSTSRALYKRLATFPPLGPSPPPPLLAALLAGLVRRGVGLAAGRGHRVHHVHGCGDAVVDHAANGGHGAVDDLGQLGPLDRVEAGEDPVGSPAPKAGRGLADADPDANELGGSEALNHAPHAVIAGMPAADLDAHLAPRQVELVVNDEHSRRWHLEEGHRRLNAVAREVHERLRLQQGNGRPTREGAARPHAGELLLVVGPAPPLAEGIGHDETDVVPASLVLAPRIAEADDEMHGKPRLLL